MTIALDAIPIVPWQTASWLVTNNPLLPRGSTFREIDTGKTKTALTGDLNWNSILSYDQLGPVGPAGPSAYDVAVSAGFTGTVVDWLTDPVDGIKGDKGNDGSSFVFVKSHGAPPTVFDVNTLYGRY